MLSLYHKILSRLPSKKGRQSLNELQNFMAQIGGINFQVRRVQDESGEYFIAESTNLDKKHIITTGKTLAELDNNIKDAIFSSFHVPAYYCDERVLKSPLKQDIQLQYAAS